MKVENCSSNRAESAGQRVSGAGGQELYQGLLNLASQKSNRKLKESKRREIIDLLENRQIQFTSDEKLLKDVGAKARSDGEMVYVNANLLGGERPLELGEPARPPSNACQNR